MALEVIVSLLLPLSTGFMVCGMLALARAKEERRKAKSVVRLPRGRRRKFSLRRKG